MKIVIRHGGYGCFTEYRNELDSLERDYGQPVDILLVQEVFGTATAIDVDFGDSAFQVDTEANVINKVRECLRRVDIPQWKK